eukprot:sb/3479020/
MSDDNCDKSILNTDSRSHPVDTTVGGGLGTQTSIPLSVGYPRRVRRDRCPWAYPPPYTSISYPRWGTTKQPVGLEVGGTKGLVFFTPFPHTMPSEI